ncbi:MAG: hypothetical protein K8R02_00260 [Anaerohalosphaeraceae bacterium]|nr:hypothetical protein [Anaerohalosphaeraceae bacterium]
MKNLRLVVLAMLVLSATMVLAAPSLRITSPPVMNNGWTGPMIDPPASLGQWFLRLPDGIEEARTHEFYDNVIEHGGGLASYFAIEGVAFNLQYNAGNLVYFEINATITNDTPASTPWADGTNSHGETLSVPEQYEGILYDTKLTVEFAIERGSYDNWIALWGSMTYPPYQDIFPHIEAIEPNQLGWYCWTPENEPQLMPFGDYLVPTYDFGDIAQGASATRVLKFTVDGGGLPAGDPRRIAIEQSAQTEDDIFLNRTTSLKISTWMDWVAVDNGQPYPGEVGRSSDVSVFHNIEGPVDPNLKWLQRPDLSEMGIDIKATEPFILADDFECNETNLITEITVWGSWKYDMLPEGGPDDVKFILSLHTDIPDPDPADPCTYSMPAETVWLKTFEPKTYYVTIERDDILEGWWSPDDPFGYTFPGDTICFKYVFTIDPCDAFVQEGTLEMPIVYWLDVQAEPNDSMGEAEFGWKTSLEHWNDDAVWGMGVEPYFGPWNELRYPFGHELHPESLDLAFAIKTTPIQECFDSTHPDYVAWVSAGRPTCWCYTYQCRGDADGAVEGDAKNGYHQVGAGDLFILQAGWLIKEPPQGPGIGSVPNGICADFARDLGGDAKNGYHHVGATDLFILQTNWLVKNPPHGPSLPGGCGGSL